MPKTFVVNVVMLLGVGSSALGQATALPCERQQLFANDGAGGDLFGSAVAMSGDTLVIGARGDDNIHGFDAGAAYVFVWDGSSWTQQAKLMALDGAAEDHFGESVAISGNTIVVGVPFDNVGDATDGGSAYVFVRDGATWTQQIKFTAPKQSSGDRFGWDVAVGADTVVVGAPQTDNSGGLDAGAAYAFVRSGTFWTLPTTLAADDAEVNAYFGSSVAIDGDTAVVCAQHEDNANGTDAGAAYVYVRNGTSWTQQAKLIAINGATDDTFGYSCAVRGDTAIVGAPAADVSGTLNAGAAYVFVRTGTSWSQQAKLTDVDATGSYFLGGSVAMDGSYALVGASGATHANQSSGAASIFVRSGAQWVGQSDFRATNGLANDAFGGSVAIEGGKAVIGAYQDDNVGGGDAGSAYIFSFTPDCNGNGVADACDITSGISHDTNTNGIPDECECYADITEDGVVDVSDLLLVITLWGPCANPVCAMVDIAPHGGDGQVNVADLLLVITSWGRCP